MARIRSIHPGIFTDEAYMALSFPARELIKGLWCEADDHGMFEWKPLTLKARILPADNIDMMALLLELEDGDFVRQFDAVGKRYGAIRNFGRYQRPKKPKYVHPVPEELHTYIASKADGGEPVPHQDDTSGEEPPQREEEGGRRGEEEILQKEEFKNSDSEGIEDDDPLALPKFLAKPNGRILLKTETFEKARELAPRYDVYHIERCWRDWPGNDMASLKDPDKAFLGFVRKHVEANPL